MHCAFAYKSQTGNARRESVPSHKLTDHEWEALCNQCGLCCFEKSRLPNGRILTSRIPCAYLDIHSRQCRVYEHRFNVGEECQKLTPELVAEVDWLPEQCAYVQWQKKREAQVDIPSQTSRHKSRRHR
jgi:uncharacterized cysteine cluster protein YcgN (CxxCxxCC family)